jgi:hypothetical protein
VQGQSTAQQGSAAGVVVEKDEATTGQPRHGAAWPARRLPFWGSAPEGAARARERLPSQGCAPEGVGAQPEQATERCRWGT